MTSPAQSLRLISILFFLSGIPALIYQLVWQRALFRVFGVNVESVTIVVTAFMLGLGIGSLAGGWVSRHTRLPLLVLLALVEFGIGLYGLFSLQIIDSVSGIAANLPLSAMAPLNLALITIPTLLMGATLPVLVGYLVRINRNVGASVGHLYYVNTLGAGAACLISAVVIFPFLGMQEAVWLATGGNFLLAAGALVAFLTGRGEETADTLDMPVQPGTIQRHISDSEPLLPFALVLALAFFSGLISLSFEILFFRVISFTSANSALAFALTLGVFLIGLAGGARDASELCRGARADIDKHRWLVKRLFWAGVIGAIFLPVLSCVAFLNVGVFGVALILIYLLARAWGALLPYLADLGVRADQYAGQKTAIVIMVNIVGSAVGAVFTGFVLLEYLTMSGLAELLAICGLLLTAFTAWKFGLLSRQHPTLAISLVALLVGVPLLHPLLTKDVVKALLRKDLVNIAPPLTTVIESRSGIIAVDTAKIVYGHGIYDGRYNIDAVNDLNGIYRPLATPLYHASPKNVLFIGLSTGSWVQVVANLPGVDSVTVVELNQGYNTLVAQHPEVASLLRNKKVHIVVDDGRRWLRKNPDARFDLVISNTTHHFRANATNLLSVEFISLVQAHLAPSGAYFYNTTGSDRAMRTGCLSFAHGMRIGGLMLGSDQPVALDVARWRRAMTGLAIDGKLVFDPTKPQDMEALEKMQRLPAQMDDPTLEPKQKKMEDCASILRRTEDIKVMTDNNMGNEWRYFLGLSE